MTMDSNELRRASEEVEGTPAPASAGSEQMDEPADASVQPAPRRRPGRPRKSVNQTPTKALTVKATETILRRSTRANSRKSESIQATTSDQDDMPVTSGAATTPAPSVPEVALAVDEEMQTEDNIVVAMTKPAANEQRYIPGDHAAQTPEPESVSRSEEREPPSLGAPTPMPDSTTFVPTPNTSNQTPQPLGGLYKSKYAQIPTAECSPKKRSLAEDGIEDQSDHGGARSMKRARLFDNTCTPGPSTATFPNNQTIPSKWSGHVWAPTNTTMRNEKHRHVSSDREETTGRSTADRDTVEREVIQGVMIKQEPLTDDRSGDRQLSPQEVKLLDDLQEKVNRVLGGGEARVDVMSQIPAWMRLRLSNAQKKILQELHQTIACFRRNNQPGNGRGNPVATRPAPVPARPAPAPQRHVQAQPLARAATTQPQTQLSVPQQGGQVLALSDLDINNLSGMSLVNSAVQKINELLRLAGQDSVQFSLSGRDKLIFEQENRP
ncbi:hypothetical protein TUN199_05674 [Pyrenophora tritici-repentis]|nr:hypothetical protein PtrV1_11830 [Pyrenophora tritici-repentis]KAF7444624.1 hypothetical protein A1F99_111770 [Pyrenophora tritici-repentis]KAI0586162.1 hypothetical protein Alg130_04380 [Pyrenophora tritici-repentis]KAI0611391.1 hypothetical protein TUN205_04354 [Pyrenophora tritici-repentis]KAI0622329.1 hypothetical protein TUN199_05674 [Pyrenophora tritici-repentis]